MKLIVDSRQGAVRQSGSAETLELDRYHALDDSHRFIIRSLSRNGLMIEIKQGKKTVQQGVVRFLSATAGHRREGGSYLQSYELNLSPSQPIYPLSGAVDIVLSMGVKNWQISPMFTNPLRDCVADHSKPVMTSDGEVTHRDIGEEGDTFETALMSAREFTVSNATWAVLSFEGKLSHVYLWHGAEQPDSIAALKAAITEL